MSAVDDFDGVIGKGREVGDAVVNICGFVDANKRLVEDAEKVTEKL